MAKSSKRRGRNQARRSKSSKELERVIKADERLRLASERARVRRDKERERIDARKAKDYSKKLAQLEKTGIYQPRGHELTKYRKGRINAAIKQFGRYLDKSNFFFVPVKKKAVLADARSLHMNVVPKGIFVEREGFQRIRLRKSKSHKGEFEYIREGQTKRGINKGKIRDEITPITSLDKLFATLDDVRAMANSFGTLAGNQRISFVIKDKHESYSETSFSDVDMMIDYIDQRYLKRRSEAAGLFFLRHLTVVRTTVGEWHKLARAHRSPKRRAKKRKV